MTTRIYDAPYSNEFKIPAWYSEDGKGNMKDGKFFFTAERGGWFNCDWLVVSDTPYSCFYTNIPRERRILFIVEPPEIRDYKKFVYYLEQFGVIVSQYDFPGYTGKVIISNPNLGWFLGVNNEMSSFPKAMNYKSPAKTKLISIISSLKQKTQYHRKRVEFLHALQKEFAGIIDCYGRDFNPIDDKLEAIAPYKYHVVIENSRLDYYWTEKLIDAWAGWTLPIYCGDPKILSQVPDKNGLVIIDVDDVDASLRKIHEVLDADIYNSRLEAIKTCREWALKASNRYELVTKIIDEAKDNTPKLEKPELFKIILSTRKTFVYNMLKAISPKLADKIFLAYCKHHGRFWE